MGLWCQNRFKQFKALSVSLALTSMLAVNSSSWAQVFDTDNYEPFKTAIKTLDAGASFRDDGLVTMSDGSQYVLIQPPQLNPTEIITVTTHIPQKATTPDLIGFSDNHYLVRIVTLPNGRKTFPLIAELPDTVANGLLPQNFSFPEGFLIPTIWKSITGNLLIHETPEATAFSEYPLAVFNAAQPELLLWNPAKGASEKQLSLPCAPGVSALSADANTLFVGCQSTPRLLMVTMATEKVDIIDLPHIASALVVTPKAHPTLYVSYKEQPFISVVNSATRSIERQINIPTPAVHLAFSPFRHQLYASSNPNYVPPMDIKSLPSKKRVQVSLFSKRKPPESSATQSINTTPRVHIINTATQEVLKSIPAHRPVSLMYIQDQKVLWMVDNTSKQLQAFDLRWQEYASPIPLPQAAIAMDADDTWLYFLCPEQNTIERLHLKTLAWGQPITMAPGTRAQSMILDPIEHQAYILTTAPDGLGIVNLSRAEWVGVQPLNITSNGNLAWLIPEQKKPDQQVKIKFQDGRLMLQNKPQPQ